MAFGHRGWPSYRLAAYPSLWGWLFFPEAQPGQVPMEAGWEIRPGYQELNPLYSLTFVFQISL